MDASSSLQSSETTVFMDASSSLQSSETTVTASDEPREFSSMEIMDFTSDLKFKIGYGGSAEVYKGEFFGGVQIAVKVIKIKDPLFEIFKAEVATMQKISHQYIVNFYGFCFHPQIQALVFEYMEKGSLDNILFGNHEDIEWEELYNISIKTAEGLSYLHHDCEQQIFHFDIKPGNVLLDSNFSPKIGDFGLAKLMDRNKSHLTMSGGFRGTCGYAAPETWNWSSQITCKCDVYSFGMMLFEVLRKRRNNDEENWFPEVLWDKFVNRDLDRSIIHDFNIKQTNINEAKILSMVGLWCIQYTAEIRPSMREVVNMLLGRNRVDRPPNPFFVNNPRQIQTQTSSIEPQEEVNLPLNQRSDVGDYDAIAPLVSNMDLEESYKNTSDDANQAMLKSFEKRCPPGGKSLVIVYITSHEAAGTIFVECNFVRSILNLHRIQMFERNVYEDPVYQEELRQLIGETKVPMVFVRGRLIGGTDEIMKLNREGKLKILFDGMPTI